MIRQSAPHKVYFGQVQMCNTTFYTYNLLREDKIKGNKTQFRITGNVLLRKNNFDKEDIIACPTEKTKGH